MTKERRKAVLILAGTLIIGILIGMLTSGVSHKMRGRGGMPQRGMSAEHKSEWFAKTILRIVRPDSNQVAQVRPIAQWAAHRIDSIEAFSNQQLAVILDSVKTQLKPIITDEQLKRLNEFDNKAQDHWRGDRRDGRDGRR